MHFQPVWDLPIWHGPERPINQTIDAVGEKYGHTFDLDKEAERVENAVKKVLAVGYRTIDLAKPGEPQVKCDEMGTLIAERV